MKKGSTDLSPDFKATIDRIAEKRKKDSLNESATYAITILTGILQKERALQPRTDALQQIVINFVKVHNNASKRDLLKHLESLVKKGVIETIKEGVIEWTDKNGHVKDTPLKALDSRLSRAKKL